MSSDGIVIVSEVIAYQQKIHNYVCKTSLQILGQEVQEPTKQNRLLEMLLVAHQNLMVRHYAKASYICHKKLKRLGAGEIAQQLRALTALPEVLSSIPSNHMVAHNHL